MAAVEGPLTMVTPPGKSQVAVLVQSMETVVSDGPADTAEALKLVPAKSNKNMLVVTAEESADTMAAKATARMRDTSMLGWLEMDEPSSSVVVVDDM